MPRLAPVRSSVRRGVLLDEEGINGSLVLRHARPCAGHPRLPLVIAEDVDARDEPGHDGFFRDRASLWTMADPAPRGGIRCGRAGGTGGRARIRTAQAERASRSSPAGAVLRR